MKFLWRDISLCSCSSDHDTLPWWHDLSHPYTDTIDDVCAYGDDLCPGYPWGAYCVYDGVAAAPKGLRFSVLPSQRLPVCELHLDLHGGSLGQTEGKNGADNEIPLPQVVLWYIWWHLQSSKRNQESNKYIKRNKNWKETLMKWMIMANRNARVITVQ